MRNTSQPSAEVLEKSPTGIFGLDDITVGGLPKGRPTLICGSAGCGKTLLGMEFLVRGATQFNEPGVFMAFEENEEELTKNVASLGFNLRQLVKRKKLLLDYVRVSPCGPMMPVVFTPTTIGDSLNVGLTCRDSVVPPSLAPQLAGRFIERLQELAQVAASM